MKYILPLFLFLLFSCQPQKENVLDLYNGYTIQLLDSEKIMEANPAIVGEYGKLFNSIEGVQIPLYKFIKSENYIIYLGKPVGVMNTTLAKKIIERQDTLNMTIVDFKNDSHLIKFKRDNHFVAAYLTNLYDQTNLVFYAVTRNQNEFKKFNEPFFKNRIHGKD